MRIIVVFAALLWTAPVFAYAGRNVREGGDPRMIAFTTLHAVKIELTGGTTIGTDAKFAVRIVDERGGKVVFEQPVTAVSKEEGKTVIKVNDLVVQPWTPADPHLYRLVLKITEPGMTVVEKEQRIGFRTFESRDGHLYLNGKPIFLRGIAINPPDRGIPDSIEKSRHFAERYVAFMKSIHVNFIRIPDNDTWYDVCDEQGMMVFGGNYSGQVNGQKPPKDYDKAVSWYENKAFAMIARHPSLMIYAMTNETPFAGKAAAEWEKFLSYAFDKLRQWDSTRVYIANAGYGYGKAGDICDLHRYWGWYYSSPFTFLHVRNNEDIIPFPKKKGQPITFTECVGNYSGPDGRYNLTPDHKNPGSQLNWTGHAPDNVQALLANEHQCFTFKQATELMRRLRSVNPELSGVFPFTILFYNWHTIHDFVDMDPKPVTRQARLSYAPVLVSWENWTTQLYAGATFQPVLHIVNDADDFSDLEGATFVYRVLDETKSVLLSDSFKLPRIAYYGAYSKQLSVALPADLPIGHYQLAGRVVQNGRVISENYSRLFVAGGTFVSAVDKPKRKILLYEDREGTGASLRNLAIPFTRIRSFASLSPDDLVVIGENSADAGLVREAAALKQFVAAGGRLLCLRQDPSLLPNLNAVLSSPVKNVTMDLDISVYPPPARPSRNGYYVNPERDGHPVFDGIDREELKVWSDYTGWKESDKKGFPAIYPVTDGFVPADKKDMGHISVLGDYGPGLEGMAIAEFFDGAGSVLLCGMDLASRKGLDPVADRLLANLAGYMGDKDVHAPDVLVTAPIIWGDYASEKGILTGINSGLLLNPRPRLTGLYSTQKIVVTKDGHELAAGSRSGFNTKPGIQYVPYGRRPFGPYVFRGFGDVAEPVDPRDSIGEGTFYCRVPDDRTNAATLAWNSSDEPLVLGIRVNDKEVTRRLAAGEKTTVDCPVTGTHIKMTFTGDRKLVLLQTAFTRRPSAHVRLPAVFGDHMVLQQRTKVPFWGWADPGEKLTIRVGWEKTVTEAQADAEGKWKVMIQTPAAGGPYTIDVKGADSIHLQDVLVGEVWLCSGQSNMVFSLKSSANAQQEIVQANFPAIRYFSVTRQYADDTFDDSPGAAWESTTPATAPSFSAVAYFFAKKLHQQLHVPVGIVYSAWGGTPAEAWTPKSVLKADTVLDRYNDRWRIIQTHVGKDSAAYHAALSKWDSTKAGKKPQEPQTLYYYKRPWREPGVLFNGMIDPVIPFAIKGALWYQGESNVNYAGEYYRLLTAMIDSWRQRWGTKEHPFNFPFYVVQIAAYGYNSLDNAARLREAEYQVMQAIPNTGMAVTADLGDMNNIHYTRKKEVGDRLALIALARDYGKKKVVYKGPEARKASVENGKVNIVFEPSPAKLSASDQAAPVQSSGRSGVKGFELGYRAPSGDSLIFVPAEATIRGKRVIVWSDRVKDPVEVRYAWLLVGEANLYDNTGLPAFPFRMKVSGRQ